MENPVFTDDDLGRLAVREGFVTNEELDAALEAQRIGNGKSLSEVLLEMNLITGSQLDRMAQLHLTESKMEGIGPDSRPPAEAAEEPPPPRVEEPPGGPGVPQPEPVPEEEDLHPASDFEDPSAPTVADPAPSSAAEIFGKVAVVRGYTSEEEVRECLEEQRKLADEGQTMRLGQIMVKRRFLTTQQFLDVLRVQGDYILVCPACKTRHFAGEDGQVLRCRGCGAVLPVSSVHEEQTAVPDRAAGEESPAEGAPTGESGDPHEGSAIQTIKVLPQPSTSQSRIEEGTLGKYQIQGEIGRGSLGVVHRALDEPLNRIVALKTLRRSASGDPKAVQMFAREAKTAARLNHESIVTIHEVGTVGDTTYFTMEYIEGDTFERLLEEGRLKRDDALRILEKVSRAIDYAHGEDVFHRNLKPANILVDSQMRPHLADFGLTKLDLLVRPLSDEAADVGTPHYLAPEQVRGEARSADARTDIYALGVMLYRIVTGMVPFPGGADAETYRKILEAEARRPRQVDPGIEAELETICRRAMERDRSLRYASAREFADDLARYLAGRPIEAKPVSVLQRLRRRARRNKALVAGLLLLVAALAFGGVWLKGYLDKLAARKEAELQKQRRERAATHLKKADAAWAKLFGKGGGSSAEAKRHVAALEEGIASALKEDEKWADPHALRARLLQAKGDLDGALEAWDMAVERDPLSRAGRMECRLIRFGLLSGAPLRLAGMIGQPAAPENLDSEWAKAERDAMLQDALALLQEAEKLNKGLRLCADGVKYLAEGKYDEAGSRAARVDSRNEHYAMALRLGALASFRKGDYQSSFGDFLDLVALRPKIEESVPAGEFGFYRSSELQWAMAKVQGPEGAVFRGLAAEALGDVARAEKEYGSRPESAEALAKRAFLCMGLENYAEARKHVDAACRLDKDHPEALLARAAVLTHEGNHRDAMADLGRVEKAQSVKSVCIHYLYGQCRLQSDQRDRAMMDAKKALDLLPTFYPAHALRANVNIKLRNFLGAEDDAKRALKLKAEYVPAIVTLARIQAERKNFEAAVRKLDEAIRLKKEDPALYILRGRWKIELREPQGALDDFNLALKYDPNNLEAQLFRAIALLNINGEEGMRALEDFIAAHPKYPEGYALRGRVRAMRREWDGAIEDLEKAVELGAADPATLRNLIMQCKVQRERENRTPTSWRECFQRAHQNIMASNEDESRQLELYRKARELYLVGINDLPNPLPDSEQDRRFIYVCFYNLACTYGVEAHETKDKEKRAHLIDEAFKWLKKSFELGFASDPCGGTCHPDGTGRDHARDDEDLEPLFDDPRFKKLIKKVDEGHEY